MSNTGPVGFIGLGAMGYGMARNLVEKDHAVLAYDLREQPLHRLVQQGAKAASSIAEVGRSCDQVMVMVINAEQVHEVVCGDGGLLENMDGGTILIHSTIALSDLLPVAEAAKGRGVALIDCPVSGGESGANEGTLTILCGGAEETVKNHRHLLDAVAASVTHLGPLGAGMVGKLANNLILGVGRLAIAEAFALAKKAGLSTEALYNTMLTCTADSRQLRGLGKALVSGEYPEVTFHGLKDIGAAVDSGRAVGQAMPITSLAREFYQLADQKTGGLKGSDHVMRYILDQ